MADAWSDEKIREAFIYDGGESDYHDPVNGHQEQRRVAGGIFDAWLAAHDAKVRAEEREKAVQIAKEERSGNYDYPEDWTPYAHGNNAACDAIFARIREQGS